MARRPLPQLRLPRTDRPYYWSVVGSVGLHLAILLLIVAAQATRPAVPTRRPGPPGVEGGGGGLRFIRLDQVPPAAPASSRPAAEEPVVPEPTPIVFTPRRLDLRLPTGPVILSGDPAAAGAGSGGGVGRADGPGLGDAVGPGTGGEGGEVFPPRARYSILPPLPQPASVRGRAYRVHFWVDVDGRVSRVRVEPEIKDAAYRQQFLAMMREYTFEPARKADGTRVDGETVITITL